MNTIKRFYVECWFCFSKPDEPGCSARDAVSIALRSGYEDVKHGKRVIATLCAECHQEALLGCNGYEGLCRSVLNRQDLFEAIQRGLDFEIAAIVEKNASAIVSCDAAGHE